MIIIIRLASARHSPSDYSESPTFVHITSIAHGQRIGWGLRILVVCNSSRLYETQRTTGARHPVRPAPGNYCAGGLKHCVWLCVPHREYMPFVVRNLTASYVGRDEKSYGGKKRICVDQ